jgi:catechol 2,3-dioxygenase
MPDATVIHPMFHHFNLKTTRMQEMIDWYCRVVGFEDLNASYLRLRDAGITPEMCIDHGMTFSDYYEDPDGNRAELQCDNFGDWAKSAEWMCTSDQFHSNPIGVFVEPEHVAQAAAAGEPFAEIHRRAMAGEFAPEQPPVEIPTEG